MYFLSLENGEIRKSYNTNKMKELFKRLFHRCGENLEYIEGSRWPNTGTTGKGKVWRNYRCSVCGKLYTTSGGSLISIQHPLQNPIKITCGGNFNSEKI